MVPVLLPESCGLLYKERGLQTRSPWVHDHSQLRAEHGPLEAAVFLLILIFAFSATCPPCPPRAVHVCFSISRLYKPLCAASSSSITKHGFYYILHLTVAKTGNWNFNTVGRGRKPHLLLYQPPVTLAPSTSFWLSSESQKPTLPWRTPRCNFVGNHFFQFPIYLLMLSVLIVFRKHRRALRVWLFQVQLKATKDFLAVTEGYEQ